MSLKDDEFFGESDKIKKFQALLKSEFNKRKILTAKNESTALIDAGIRGKFDEYEKSLIKLKSFVTGYQKKPIFSQNEINRRVQLYQDMHQHYNTLKTQFNSMLIKKSYNDTDDIEININTNTGGKPADLHQQLQEEFKVQEEVLDNFGGLVKKIKNQNKAIGNELDSQSPLLKNLGKEMERVENKMKKTDGKLDTYLQQSSNNCLMMVICIEFVLLVIFLLI